MAKNIKKLVKRVWNKYTKCSLYVSAFEKSGNNNKADKTLDESRMYVEYVNGILNCLKKTDYNVLVAQYIKKTGNDGSYTRTGWYAKIRRANIALIKYFDTSLLKKKKWSLQA